MKLHPHRKHYHYQKVSMYPIGYVWNPKKLNFSFAMFVARERQNSGCQKSGPETIPWCFNSIKGLGNSAWLAEGTHTHWKVVKRLETAN